MTFHYHGTPITPTEILYSLAGKMFCVSHAAPSQVALCHRIGQSVMLDNGAFSVWKRGHQMNMPGFYAWTDAWLHTPSSWAVIPDVINGGETEQDELLRQWPHGKRQSSPVWHMDEPIKRLIALCDDCWDRVCVGSSSEYEVVLSPAWERRMDETWNEIMRVFGRAPKLHMLRGLRISGMRWPFYSCDSTDVARNHHLQHNNARKMADRWDAVQCVGPYEARAIQQRMFV